MIDEDELAALRAENTRLIALLDAHGIAWRSSPAPMEPPVAEPSHLTIDERVALFRRLFRGRTDVHPIRWESRASGRSASVLTTK